MRAEALEVGPALFLSGLFLAKHLNQTVKLQFYGLFALGENKSLQNRTQGGNAPTRMLDYLHDRS